MSIKKIRRDLTGLTFGNLTIIKFSHFQGRFSMWKCKCNCGNETIARGSHITNMSIKTCGKNYYYQEKDYMIGTTHSGCKFKFDNEDFEIIKKYIWHDSNGYLQSYDKDMKKNIKMHNILMNPKCNEYVDHINRNPSDNRKYNLRTCNCQQNNFNRAKAENKTSKYKGIHWHNERSKWRASIRYNYKLISIGSYNNEIDAAKAYNKKAKELFGEFAYLNEI